MTKPMVGVTVVMVVLVLLVVSSQLWKCACRGGYLTKLKVGVMVMLVVGAGGGSLAILEMCLEGKVFGEGDCGSV